MIRTQQQRVPWLWIFLLTTTSSVFSYVDQCTSIALTFTMKKFVSDPALITFLGSLNIAFTFLISPYAAWKSDRIWTRWGRRKVFMIPAWGVLALALIATPLAPSIWILTGVIIVYQVAVDFGYVGPWSPLFYEVVPMHQRGRATVIKRLMIIGAILLFNYVMIGQFDAIYNLSIKGMGLKITGEQLIYFLGAAMVLSVVAHLIFNVKEEKPKTQLPPEKFSPGKYLGAIFGNRQWRMVYMLVFCSVALTTGLAQLNGLLITEQFGYSKDLMGKMTSLAMVLQIVLVMPLVALIADRYDRFRIFQIGLFLSTLHPLVYWLFVAFLAPNHIPSPTAIILFNLANSLVDALAGLALEPLFFDYAPRNQMGTLNAGMLFVKGAMSLVVINGVGLWVKGYSAYFAPAGKYDYMSGYLYIFMIGSLGCAASVYFDSQRRKGRIIEYGKLEEEQQPEQPANPTPQEPHAATKA